MLFNRRSTLVEHQCITIGEFDITVDGAYKNIITYPLNVKKDRDVFVSVKSDNGVDVSVVNTKGYNTKFSEGVKNAVIGPIHTTEKCTMALILGVYRGDLAHVELEAWME